MIAQVIFAVLILSATLFFDSAVGFNGVVPIGVAFACFLLVVFSLERFRVNDLIAVMVMCVFACFTLALTFSYWRSDPAQYKNFTFVILGFLTFLTTKSLVYHLQSRQIARILNGILLFHIAIFLVQLALYRTTGFDLDVGKLLGGLGHRALTPDGLYRPTGVFDEPAIYAMFTSALLVCRMFYCKNKDIIFWLALACLCLTMSLVAYILAAGIFFAYGSMTVRIVCIVLGMAVVALLFSPLMSDTYVGIRAANVLSGADASTNSKSILLQDWLNTPQLWDFGFGFIGLRDWTPSYYDAMFDLSFYLSILVVLGFMSGLCVLVWFFLALVFSTRPLSDKLAILVVLLKLTALQFPMLWILMALFFSKSRNRVETDKSFAPLPSTAGQIVNR
ncbi:MAG TPA: hypothetical protein DD666_07675 [Advenella kashmirensis]|uniref:Polysaccharide polymerase n=1 Tax=Advenella kashmirensis TaxID=310575 RepID=A0A356LE58_9BURK|nr:hypothetical protein [Advenella kashmirensis]